MKMQVEHEPAAPLPTPSEWKKPLRHESHAVLIDEIAVARNEARAAREACDLSRRIIRGSLLKGGCAFLSPRNAVDLLALLDRAADGSTYCFGEERWQLNSWHNLNHLSTPASYRPKSCSTALAPSKN